MYLGDVINRLNKHIIRISNIDYYPAQFVRNEIESVAKECIRWSIEDFKYAAKLKRGENWEEWYDTNRFEEALHNMINKHDGSFGITWDTVESYLDEYCRLKDDPIK